MGNTDTADGNTGDGFSMDDINALIAETDRAISDGKEKQAAAVTTEPEAEFTFEEGDDIDFKSADISKQAPKPITIAPTEVPADAADFDTLTIPIPGDADFSAISASTTIRKKVTTPPTPKPGSQLSDPAKAQEIMYEQARQNLENSKFSLTKEVISFFSNLKPDISLASLKPNISLSSLKPNINLSRLKPNIDFSNIKNYLPSRKPTLKEGVVFGSILTAGAGGLWLAYNAEDATVIANRIFSSGSQPVATAPRVPGNVEARTAADYDSMRAFSDMLATTGYVFHKPEGTDVIIARALGIEPKPTEDNMARALPFTLPDVTASSIDMVATHEYAAVGVVTQDNDGLDAVVSGDGEDRKVVAPVTRKVTEPTGPSQAVLDYRANLSNAETAYNNANQAYDTFTSSNPNPTKALQTAEANYSRLEGQVRDARTTLDSIQQNPTNHTTAEGDSYISIAQLYLKKTGCVDCDPTAIAQMLSQDNEGRILSAEGLHAPITTGRDLTLGQAYLFLFPNDDYESRRTEAQNTLAALEAQLRTAQGVRDSARSTAAQYRKQETVLRTARDNAKVTYETLITNPITE